MVIYLCKNEYFNISSTLNHKAFIAHRLSLELVIQTISTKQIGTMNIVRVLIWIEEFGSLRICVRIIVSILLRSLYLRLRRAGRTEGLARVKQRCCSRIWRE